MLKDNMKSYQTMSEDTKSQVHRQVTVIDSNSATQIFNLKEVIRYRDLLYFMVRKEIRVRYAQSSLGIGWAIIQPLFSMIVFSVIFGKFAKLGSEGAPYAVFSLAALLPWTFFSNAISDGVGSLVNEADLMRKVYFPRIILPLTCILSKLVDFLISGVIMVVLLLWYQTPVTPTILWIPLGIAMMLVTAFGVSIWLTALAIQYRDVRYSLTFMIQLLMYASPVVYSLDLIPRSLQLVYALNPMVGVITIFRTGFLANSSMPLGVLSVGLLSSFAILLSGLFFFSAKEKIFTDVS